MKMKALAFAAIISTGGGSSSMAEQLTCQLTMWKGSKDQEASISWTGTSFIADMKNLNVKVSGGGMATQGWVPTLAKRNSKFTTLSFNDLATEENRSKKHQAQFDFRLYKTGKCSVYVKVGRFEPIVAEGRIK